MREQLRLAHLSQHTLAMGALILAAVSTALTIIAAVVTVFITAHLVGEQRKLERKDVSASRSAQFRLCERANYTRAELHVAYSTDLVPKGELAKIAVTEPALAALVSTSQTNSAKGLKRVQFLNPILFCRPNLRGREAKKRDKAQQEAFVREYRKLKLKPLPGPKPRE